MKGETDGKRRVICPEPTHTERWERAIEKALRTPPMSTSEQRRKPKGKRTNGRP